MLGTQMKEERKRLVRHFDRHGLNSAPSTKYFEATPMNKRSRLK